MGRSKFPGKPPKTVTRKRIKVLGRPEADNQNDSVTVAENIYYGLSLFNDSLGGNGKKVSLLQEHPPFHGFSSNEAKLSVSYVKTQQRDGGVAEKGPPSQTEAVAQIGDAHEGVHGGQTSSSGVENAEESSEKTNIEDEASKRSREDESVVATEPATENIDESSEKNTKFESTTKGPLKSVNNILDRHQRTRQLRNSTAKRLLRRAKTGNNGNVARNMSVQCGDKNNGGVRKFVLPVRSAHSSRVIKPNKRFIEELEESIYVEHCENETVKNSKKAKIAAAKNEKMDSSSSKNATSSEQSQSDDREARKSKKMQSIAASSTEISERISMDSISTSSNADAQKSKESRNDGKKIHNKSTNRNSCNSTFVGQDNVDKTATIVNSGGKNVVEITRLGEKKLIVPTKVLPDFNVPNVESSRVQTRSGTQSETYGDANSLAKPEVLRETHEWRDNEETDGIVDKSNCKNVVGFDEAETDANERTRMKRQDESESESTQSESTSEHDDHSEDEQSEWSGMKLNGGKVILRKARLKLDNKTLGGTEGPFSNTNSHGGSHPGPTATVKCGVCGAVRFYRFSKQARKFGIHSCESCRKFISKMIKRQACAKTSNATLPILQCHKGDGMCLVPPVVRSQQWNLMRCVYKARCPACWLKMCLKCYNVPSALRTGLNGLLPPLMRDSVTSVSLVQDDNEAICQNKSLGVTKISWPAEDCLEKNLFKSAMSWSNSDVARKLSCHTNAGGLLSKKLEKFDYPISISPGKKRKNDNRIKVRKKLKNPLLITTSSHCPSQPRQRIDLKGPRVKHVCRSASVALGQPLATFPSGDGKDAEVDATTKIAPKVSQSDDKSEKKNEIPRDKENNSQKSNQESSCTSSSNSTSGSQTSCAKRNKSQLNVFAPNRQVVRSLPKPRIDAIHTISIDFWEQYDPAEVGSKGFPLIGSELFHIPAVCFLCGSGGKEPLIHCQCCCEPYHAFCLEPSEWNACAMPNWCCPRCTICQTCRLRSGSKLSCVRCRQSFHHSCLTKSGVSSRLYSPDRPYVCQSCVKCKSCGSEGVNVHVGNLPLCSMCFKLRQRGNYCPLCQRFYNENDCDTKMMECNECSCWVHARCEGLSDESYQIMSYLPDSIEFTCSQCSPRPDSIWRTAINTELRAGFASVVKSLCKNRKTRAALKWSPTKECSCKPPTNARKSDHFDIRAINESSEESNGRSSETTSNSTNVDSKSDNSSRARNDVDALNDNKRIDVPRRGLRRIRQKFRFKECAMRVKNRKIANNRETNVQEHPNDVRGDCQCTEQQIIARPAPSLAWIKRKVHGNEYNSLVQFYRDIEQLVNRSGSQDLSRAYHNCLREIFPWFDPESSKITNQTTSTLASDKSKVQNIFSSKLNDSIVEMGKEEITRAPKFNPKNGNLYNNANSDDSRICCLCKGLGDGQELKEGRLLYCGQNEWIHTNCALWSHEVFEEIDGSLQNVHRAISRGRSIRCTECGKKGASVLCTAKNCNNTFHYPCARNVGLAFNHDKTIFCTSHLTNCQNKNMQNIGDFDVRRSIYVELDRKKKKYAEPDKIKIMIGSLTIDCLGSIVPEFSDTSEKILPSNYKCSRLYWSTVNPMKIVRYYVRTYVQMYVPESRPDVENNVTIDHSKEREKEAALMDRQKLEQLTIKQTLETLIDSVCNREVDENLAEQNNTDLLPPEIKDAIFEDLPHDLLDGISMQDIFPKMTYEDFLAMDLKTDGVFGPDLLKDEILTAEVDEIMKPPESKISKVDASYSNENNCQNDFWLHLGAKGSVHELMDDFFNAKSQKIGGRELKRSKSEVMTNNPLAVNNQRHHQRSCSLTWSCKLDGTYGPTMKRRKIPRPSTTPRSAEANVMLVDSPNPERNSLYHELRIPETIMVTVGRANTPNILSESVRELKYCIDESPGINRLVMPPRDDAKDHKRLLWQHARQQPRILQVDGPADPSSASECSSPEYNMEERLISPITTANIPQVDGTNDESSCDQDWFVYKNRHRTSSVTSPNSFENVRESSVDSPTSEKFPKIDKTFSNDSDSNDELRIPQLDGADDISSDEESTSPGVLETNVTIANYPPISELNDRPVTCKRCKCTYRTSDSYDRHLSNCDLITTSDDDSETMDNKGTSPDSRFSPSHDSMSPEFATMSPSEGHTMSSCDYPDAQVSSPLEASVASPHPAVQIEPMAQALINPRMRTVETLHQTVLTSNDVIVQTQYTRTTTTLPTSSAVLPQESTVEITEIADCPSPIDSQPSHQSPKPPKPPKPSEKIINQESPNLPLSPKSISSTNLVKNPIAITQNFSSSIPHNPNNDNPPTTNYSSSRVAKPKSPRAPRSRTKCIKPNVQRNSINQQNNNQMRYQSVQSTTPVLQLQQQRNPGPTMILQQVPTPGLMSAYVETLQQQAGQNVQYITTLGGQQESTYKPQFIATNQLVPGAYIQTGSDNLLALQNGGISVLPSVQIAQPQQTVLGTLIQQQPNSIQCGVISSEQLVLSSTPTLEMFSDSTGSMFVSSQPMYYGLETIVSNTVMSSSQFMTGAVPQVLASSYQTTTQVFQASKLMDPIVDVQTVSSMPNVPAVQAVQNVPTVHGSYVVVNQNPAGSEAIARSQPTSHRVQPPAAASQPPQHPPPPPPPPLPSISTQIAHPRDNFVARNGDTITISSCQPHVQSQHILSSDLRQPVMNSYIDPTMRIVSPTKSIQQTNLSTIPRVAVRPSPASHTVTQMNHSSWKTAEPIIYNGEQNIDNDTRPYYDSKHVSKNTSMIKSNVIAQLPSLTNHCVARGNNIVNNKLIRDVNNVLNNYNIDVASCKNNVVNNGGVINNVCNAVVQNSVVQSKLTMPPITTAPLCRPMNRVLPMQAVMPKPELIKPLEKPEIVLEEPTKPIIEDTTNDEIEKIVKIPIIDDMPMIGKDMPDIDDDFVINEPEIVIPEPEIVIPEPEIVIPEPEIVIPEPEIVIPEPEIVKTCNRTIEKTKFDNKVAKKIEDKIDVPTPLKIVLQKQLEDGSYRITHNEIMKSSSTNKNTGIARIAEEAPKQTPQITSLQLLPIKTFTLKANKADDKSANLPKPRATPIAVKKPRFVAKPATSSTMAARKDDVAMEKPSKPVVTGPSLMYEIKSQDGFTHTASSMAEVWDTVFQAVQNARKAHNLPPLAHNPLTEGLGLDNNATVYLVEQLAGVNRCTKYKPKFHDLKPPKTRDGDNDSFSGCASGAARAEAFKGRKVHDMFSWLASRHRQQPKMIAISETELRRAASTNLPMAMRFRVLKETSKESVGVYHSHIHGRGLFCLRDIEAGEMVIEYAGEVIRASLTDKREKYYDSKNIGCYMFKIDDHLVVDATMKGNAARFINHSCEPNCYSRVVDILGKKHILIFALRRIVQGEELTYDYKFPFEDIKIPCTCGSRRCRKYLN